MNPKTTVNEIKSQLPSQNMINVGVCLRYAKKKTCYWLNNGLFKHSDKVKYRNVVLEYPLEHQAPYDIIVCKLVDLFTQLYEATSDSYFDKLHKFCSDKNITLLDGREGVSHLLFRKTIDDV